MVHIIFGNVQKNQEFEKRISFLTMTTVSYYAYGHCTRKNFNVDLLVPFIVLHNPCQARVSVGGQNVPSHSL